MLVECMNLKKIGKVFTRKFVGTGPSSYKKRIYRAAVSQRLRNTGLEDLHLLKSSFAAFHVRDVGHAVKKHLSQLQISVCVCVCLCVCVLSVLR